jgi:magnesium chelatase subunit I
LALRVEVVRRRDAFDRDAAGFAQRQAKEEAQVRDRIIAARARLMDIETPDAVLEWASKLCMAVGVDGLRGELTLIRAARAVAALDGDTKVEDRHLRGIAVLALRHRLRRNPLDETGSSTRIERAIADLFGA